MLIDIFLNICKTNPYFCFFCFVLGQNCSLLSSDVTLYGTGILKVIPELFLDLPTLLVPVCVFSMRLTSCNFALAIYNKVRVRVWGQCKGCFVSITTFVALDKLPVSPDLDESTVSGLVEEFLLNSVKFVVFCDTSQGHFCPRHTRKSAWRNCILFVP